MSKRISCQRKIKHKSKDGAYASLRDLLKKGFIACVYKCRKCGYYHVGKPSFNDSPKQFWHNIENRIKRNS